MATIQANAQGKVQQARKRLKKNLQQLKQAGALNAAQRDALFADALMDLHRIELWRLGRLEDEEQR